MAFFPWSAAGKAEKLNKRYQALLQQAMQAQRAGDIRLYSQLSEQADHLLKQIEATDKSRVSARDVAQ